MITLEPPEAGSQACPRSLRLLPDRLLVPPATLALLLRRGSIPLLYSGWGFEPAVRDGATIEARGGLAPRRGDLVIASRAGHVDLLRLIAPRGGEAWQATLDGYPRRRVTLDPPAILGIVTAVDGRPPQRRRSLLACCAGLGAVSLAARRVIAAPRWGATATDTVLEKYASQVATYVAAGQSNLTGEQARLLAENAGPGGQILVAGCGSGAEALQLARAGHRVVGFDALPGMIEAASAAAGGAGADARFAIADVRRGDWPRGPYDAAYLTPLLYSFVAGRDHRIGFLRRLGRSLRRDGVVLYSARLHPGARSWIETRLSWCRRVAEAGLPEGEPGDWYTRYLAPDGSIRHSYLRRFAAGEVLAEGRAAGFTSMQRQGADFLAGRFRTP